MCIEQVPVVDYSCFWGASSVLQYTLATLSPFYCTSYFAGWVFSNCSPRWKRASQVLHTSGWTVWYGGSHSHSTSLTSFVVIQMSNRCTLCSCILYSWLEWSTWVQKSQPSCCPSTRPLLWIPALMLAWTTEHNLFQWVAVCSYSDHKSLLPFSLSSSSSLPFLVSYFLCAAVSLLWHLAVPNDGNH